jgi:hypothetical protein
MRVIPALAFLVITLVNVEVSAAAGKAPTRESLEKAAKKACITGDVVKGTDILGDLYVETNDPTYIYNQGRCFEQSHRWRDAIDRFLEYLRKVPSLPPDQKIQVERHVTDCKAQLAEQTGSQPTPAAPRPPIPEPASVVPAAPEPPVAAIVTLQSDPESNKSGSGLRTAGIISGIVGVGGLSAGVILALKTHSLSDQLNKPDGYDRDTANTVSTYRTWGWVSYGVGAAALVTGTVLYLVGRSTTSDSTPSVAFLPTIAPGEAAFCLKGTY